MMVKCWPIMMFDGGEFIVNGGSMVVNRDELMVNDGHEWVYPLENGPLEV